MSAREIIASAEVEFMHGVPVHPTLRGADSILAALTAAGYRILAPGEVDAETVELAKAAAYHDPDYLDGSFPKTDEEGLHLPGSPYDRGRYDARRAIRSLGRRA